MLAHDAVFFVVLLLSFSPFPCANQTRCHRIKSGWSQRNLPSFRRTNIIGSTSKKSNKDLLEESRERERERKKDEKPSSFSSCSSSTASPSKVPFHPPRALRKSAISRVKKVKKRKANYYSGQNFFSLLCLGYQNGCFSPCFFPGKKWSRVCAFARCINTYCVVKCGTIVVLYHPYF